MVVFTSLIIYFVCLQDIKAYHALPLPGYVVIPVSAKMAESDMCSMCVMLWSLSLSLSLLPLVGSEQLHHSTASSIQQEGTR
jgi:hypothetical protein